MRERECIPRVTSTCPFHPLVTIFLCILEGELNIGGGEEERKRGREEERRRGGEEERRRGGEEERRRGGEEEGHTSVKVELLLRQTNIRGQAHDYIHHLSTVVSAPP